MKNILCGLLLIAAVGLSGCTFLFNYGKVTVVSSTPGTEKAVDGKYYYGTIPKQESISGSSVFFSTNKKSGLFTDSIFKIRNKKTQPVFITETKTGYLPQTTYIPTTKPNIAKLFSYIPIALMPLVFIDSEPFLQIGAYSYLYTVCYGLGELLFGAGRIYPYKTIVLPPLKPLPHKQADENFIILDSVIVSCKIDKFDISHKTRFYKYFDSTYKFEVTHQHSSLIKRRELEYEFYKTADQMMVDYGYTDTSSALFSSDEYNTNLLKITVKEIKGKIPRFKGGQIADLTLEFNLVNMLGSDTLITKEFTYGAIYPTYEFNLKNAINKSFKESIVQFLSLEDVKKAQKSRDSYVQTLVENWDTLSIIQDEIYCRSPKEAVKSVVTVINEKSHGSACCVSSKGYFITASHVVNNNPDNIYIMTSDGKKIKCEIVRLNLKCDLALLKASETVDMIPIKISSDGNDKPGTDVYAIGTPADIELGQSMSKGIVSGKRKIMDLSAIQTDVSISPGHSGGALVNEKGELIGIIGSKVVGSGLEGLAFGIPVSYIQSSLKFIVK